MSEYRFPKINISRSLPLRSLPSTLVILVEEARSVALPTTLPKAIRERLGTVLRRERFKGAEGELVKVTPLTNDNPALILIVGIGAKPHAASTIRNAAKAILAELFSSKHTDVAILCSLSNELFEPFLVALGRLPKKDQKPLRTIQLVCETSWSPLMLPRIQSVASGIALARELVNLPANVCTPHYVADCAKDLARENGLVCEVHEERELEKMGARLLLAVGRGSEHTPCLVKLVYRPKDAKAPAVVSLVGKGVTFDSGGISIKPASGMHEMKGDMAGAAAVIGAMEAVSRLRPNIEVRAYIPLAENMVSGRAMRPGDLVTGLAGKSVEILDTDAEGRLILADALALAERDQCDSIIELSTLTGACVVALGEDYAGLFSDSDSLANEFLTAGNKAGELFWRLPLAKQYKSHIKGNIGDLKNIGNGRYGGAITAALFLREFVTKTPYLHLDIAGPGIKEVDKGDAEGFAVSTLVNFLLSKAC